MTGYHRLAEAALYRRNWDFGNINPFPEKDVKQQEEKSEETNEEEKREMRRHVMKHW